MMTVSAILASFSSDCFWPFRGDVLTVKVENAVPVEIERKI
jgi:hypothetical protein